MYVRLESIAFENKLDNTTSCRTAIIDISDSKRVHEELRQQLDFAENLIETAASIVLVLDPEGNIVRVNSFFEKLTGYAREEILGKNWFATFIPEQEQQRVLAVFANAASGVRTTGFINPIITKDGEEKIIDWYDAEQTDSQGHLIGVLSIGQDITPRIEAEMSSYESERQLRLLTDALPVLIAYIDPQQKIRFHNRHCQTWLAKPANQISGQSMGEVFGVAAYEVLSSLIDTVLAGEEVSASFELPLSPDNKPYVMANFIPDPGRNDEVKGFFALMNDITRYRTEEVSAKQRLTSLAHESRLNMMGEMAAEIAHELNQPLTAISNYADACLRLQKSDKLQPHDITDVLNEINDQAHRANQIIRHIRDFTQKRELQLQLTEVNGLIKEVLQLVSGELNWQDVSVTTQLTDARPAVIVDSVLLKQVLLNLINNAIEAMAAANTTDRRIAISTVVTNSHVAIEVADNGPGISDELTEIIFKPFFTTKAEGMGLGLSMCQSIIESHEGNLLVRENTAGGATFCIRLPLAPVE